MILEGQALFIHYCVLVPAQCLAHKGTHETLVKDHLGWIHTNIHIYIHGPKHTHIQTTNVNLVDS